MPCAAVLLGLLLFESCDPLWSKSVTGMRQSPPMMGKSLRPFVVKVRYTRQSPPTRGRSLRPLAVKVCCMRQSPPTRGRLLRALVVKVHWTRQRSPPMRGRSLRPLWSKSVARDTVLWWGADLWDPWWLKSIEQDKVLQQGASFKASWPMINSNKGHLLRPHSRWQTCQLWCLSLFVWCIQLAISYY